MVGRELVSILVDLSPTRLSPTGIPINDREVTAMAALAIPSYEPDIVHTPETVSVVVCANSLERWDDVVVCVEALEAQTRRPDQVVLVIDHDDDLLERAADFFAEWHGRTEVHVVANTRQKGLNRTRNAGLPWCYGDVIAFLDDGARADDVYWIATLIEDYADQRVAGVGGGATPSWEGQEPPGWFPRELGWVVGCGYPGLPTEPKEVDGLIGCNLSFRREVFDELGGFSTSVRPTDATRAGHVENEYCLRVRRRFSSARLVFDPDLDITHRVAADFRDFGYFRSRCWDMGVTRAEIARRVGSAEGSPTERAYTTKVLPLGILRGVADGMRGRMSGFQRAGAIVVGTVWTAAGYTRGRATRTIL